VRGSNPEQEEPSPSTVLTLALRIMARLWWRALLIPLICMALFFAAFVCQASSPDYRWLLHSVTPFASAAILAGLAYTNFVKTWDRWVVLAFTLPAAVSFLEFFLRVGW
jgi:hypothetical protein